MMYLLVAAFFVSNNISFSGGFSANDCFYVRHNNFYVRHDNFSFNDRIFSNDCISFNDRIPLMTTFLLKTVFLSMNLNLNLKIVLQHNSIYYIRSFQSVLRESTKSILLMIALLSMITFLLITSFFANMTNLGEATVLKCTSGVTLTKYTVYTLIHFIIGVGQRVKLQVED